MLIACTGGLRQSTTTRPRREAGMRAGRRALPWAPPQLMLLRRCPSPAAQSTLHTRATVPRKCSSRGTTFSTMVSTRSSHSTGSRQAASSLLPCTVARQRAGPCPPLLSSVRRRALRMGGPAVCGTTKRASFSPLLAGNPALVMRQWLPTGPRVAPCMHSPTPPHPLGGCPARTATPPHPAPPHPTPCSRHHPPLRQDRPPGPGRLAGGAGAEERAEPGTLPAGRGRRGGGAGAAGRRACLPGGCGRRSVGPLHISMTPPGLAAEHKRPWLAAQSFQCAPLTGSGSACPVHARPRRSRCQSRWWPATTTGPPPPACCCATSSRWSWSNRASSGGTSGPTRRWPRRSGAGSPTRRAPGRCCSSTPPQTSGCGGATAQLACGACLAGWPAPRAHARFGLPDWDDGLACPPHCAVQAAQSARLPPMRRSAGPAFTLAALPVTLRTLPRAVQLEGELQSEMNEVVLTHLKSYEKMGKARVACESGCT